MKSSQVIVIIILIVAGFSIFFFVKNQNKKVIRALNENGRYETYKPANEKAYSEGYSRSVVRTTEKSFEMEKSKKRNKILLTGGGILMAILVVFMLVKSNENKNDPIKNLENLKQNKIISESEYQEKIEHSKNVANEKRVLESKNREYKKLVSELDNLKAKGILTEEEYQQKLIKIKEKTA